MERSIFNLPALPDYPELIYPSIQILADLEMPVKFERIKTSVYEPVRGGRENGLQDIVLNIRAYRRNNGEYVVFIEDDAYEKVLMSRWRP